MEVCLNEADEERGLDNLDLRDFFDGTAIFGFEFDISRLKPRFSTHSDDDTVCGSCCFEEKESS
jgi:hypothetical protein